MTTVKGENRYSFLATDTETEELVEINENGEVVWKIDTALTVFDLWHLDGDRILSVITAEAEAERESLTEKAIYCFSIRPRMKFSPANRLTTAAFLSES